MGTAVGTYDPTSHCLLKYFDYYYCEWTNKRPKKEIHERKRNRFLCAPHILPSRPYIYVCVCVSTLPFVVDRMFDACVIARACDLFMYLFRSFSCRQQWKSRKRHSIYLRQTWKANASPCEGSATIHCRLRSSVCETSLHNSAADKTTTTEKERKMRQLNFGYNEHRQADELT